MRVSIEFHSSWSLLILALVGLVVGGSAITSSVLMLDGEDRKLIVHRARMRPKGDFMFLNPTQPTMNSMVVEHEVETMVNCSILM